MRDDRLYRDTYDTFENYCQSKWGWGRNYANKLIAASEAVEGLPKRLGTKVPNPTAARAVAEVPEADRAAVVTEAAKDGPVTTAKIKAAAVKIAKPSKATPSQPLKQGQQKVDLRLFAQMENSLGVTLRKLDELHKSFPHPAHHDKAINSIKCCMTEVSEWAKVKK